MNREIINRVERVLQSLIPNYSRTLDILDLGYGNPEDWDSLTNFTILTAIEIEFGVNFTLEELTDLRNVRDIIKRIEKSSYRV